MILLSLYLFSLLTWSTPVEPHYINIINGPGKNQEEMCKTLDNQIHYLNKQIDQAGLIFEIEAKTCRLVDTKKLGIEYVLYLKSNLKPINEIRTNNERLQEYMAMMDYCSVKPRSNYQAYVYIPGGNKTLRNIMITSGFEPLTEHTNNHFRLGFCQFLDSNDLAPPREDIITVINDIKG